MKSESTKYKELVEVLWQIASQCLGLSNSSLSLIVAQVACSGVCQFKRCTIVHLVIALIVLEATYLDWGSP